MEFNLKMPYNRSELHDRQLTLRRIHSGSVQFPPLQCLPQRRHPLRNSPVALVRIRGLSNTAVRSLAAVPGRPQVQQAIAIPAERYLFQHIRLQVFFF
jgi:hypothetical protein